jgi:glucosyl-3-phosphoglycerate synthase
MIAPILAKRRWPGQSRALRREARPLLRNVAAVVATLADPYGAATFHHSAFRPAALAARKVALGARLHVVIPARDEESTIGPIVDSIRRQLVEGVDLVDDLLVVDDGSRDATAALARSAGARVEAGPGAGKGEAMALGLERLDPPLEDDPGVIVVFLDGDVVSFPSHFVPGLAGPLLYDGSLDLVKARYSRPLGDDPAGGGRVTELTAKPALALFFPELADIVQPLAGEAAARGSLLCELSLAGGYAVEASMLIDTLRLRGRRAIAEVDLGERRHRNRALSDLAPQARSVLGAIVAAATESQAVS